MNYESIIEATCAEFNVPAEFIGKTVGPSVTRYEFALGAGVKLGKFTELRDNLAYALASENVRVLAPIPGKTAVGVELPNAKRDMVRLDDVVIADHHPLTVALGKTVDGDALTINLAKMPHLLVSGTTGSGKSSFVNTILTSLLRRADPEQVKLVLIDPKMVELTPYDGVPHLAQPVVTEADEAVQALEWLCREMDERYGAMRDAGVRNIAGLGLPYIVVVVDELADLMMSAERQRVEASIVRIAQKARAAGIHLVLATQRPSVDVVTGLIKANVPSRMAFAASSATDSRVMLDQAGAEALLGNGDGLYLPVGARVATRVQGAYVTDAEIAEAIEKVKVVRQVENMVDHLSADPGAITALDYLNQIIEGAEVGARRVREFLDQYGEKKKRFGRDDDQIKMFTQAPTELIAAGCQLKGLAESLKEFRTAVVS